MNPKQSDHLTPPGTGTFPTPVIHIGEPGSGVIVVGTCVIIFALVLITLAALILAGSAAGFASWLLGLVPL